MSRYITVKTMFKDRESLIAALMETGKWTLDQIEVHATPQYLYGFEGDVRKEKAHVIISRKYVGRNANDMGFIKNEEGHYEAIISEYDSSKYGTAWVGQLKGNYAYHNLARQAAARGRTISRVRAANGRQRIEITGYR